MFKMRKVPKKASKSLVNALSGENRVGVTQLMKS